MKKIWNYQKLLQKRRGPSFLFSLVVWCVYVLGVPAERYQRGAITFLILLVMLDLVRMSEQKQMETIHLLPVSKGFEIMNTYLIGMISLVKNIVWFVTILAILFLGTVGFLMISSGELISFFRDLVAEIEINGRELLLNVAIGILFYMIGVCYLRRYKGRYSLVLVLLWNVFAWILIAWIPISTGIVAFCMGLALVSLGICPYVSYCQERRKGIQPETDRLEEHVWKRHYR